MIIETKTSITTDDIDSYIYVYIYVNIDSLDLYESVLSIIIGLFVSIHASPYDDV